MKFLKRCKIAVMAIFLVGRYNIPPKTEKASTEAPVASEEHFKECLETGTPDDTSMHGMALALALLKTRRIDRTTQLQCNYVATFIPNSKRKAIEALRDELIQADKVCVETFKRLLADTEVGGTTLDKLSNKQLKVLTKVNRKVRKS